MCSGGSKTRSLYAGCGLEKKCNRRYLEIGVSAGEKSVR